MKTSFWMTSVAKIQTQSKVVFVTLLCVFWLAACSRSEPIPDTISAQGVAYYSMPWAVKAIGLPHGMSEQDVERELQHVLDDTNTVLSTYQPDTELMRFNRAPVGEWVKVSPTLFHAVATAVRVSELTGGVYDITVAPLVNLWGFGPEGRPHNVPDALAIKTVQAQVGWQYLALDVDNLALKRLKPVNLDLSSIGEGVGVDLMIEWMEQNGIKRYMSSVAGSIRVRGHRADNQPWVLAVEVPDGSGRPQRVLKLQDRAMSTSGSYRNYFEHNGMRYSHTINPKTGFPITHKGVSVTVVAPEGEPDAYADALATAFNVLGPDEGLVLAEQKGLAVFYIEKTEAGFIERYSSAFKPFLLDEVTP